MTDGLPIVPPTPERVAAAVAASGLAADQVVGDIAPLNAPATVEKIAVNAVMAGCVPEMMPVLIAAIDAFCDPQMNAHGVQTTTNPVGPMLVVNGPVRNRLGFNYGAGCFGPGSFANATVGRALRLALVNIGGAIPGEVDKAPLGWPGKSTSLCVAENEGGLAVAALSHRHGVRRRRRCGDGAGRERDVAHHRHAPRARPSAAPCDQRAGAQRGRAAATTPPNPFPTVLVMSPVIAEMVGHADAPPRRSCGSTCSPRPECRSTSIRRIAVSPPGDVLEKLGVTVENDRVPIVPSPDYFVILVAGGAGGLQSAGLSCMLGMPTSRAVPAG